MNENHARLCPSPEWAAHIQGEVLPTLTSIGSLGDEMLEVGPGPGAATEWLRHRVRRLVAVEADDVAASELSARYAGTNVEVLVGDATELDLQTASFDTVGMFTMLHHVETRTKQQRLLAEAYRVLRPGGALLGSDSLASDDLHHFHANDTYNPVEPATLLIGLQTLGFKRVAIFVDNDLMFVAHKPRVSDSDQCR